MPHTNQCATGGRRTIRINGDQRQESKNTHLINFASNTTRTESPGNNQHDHHKYREPWLMDPQVNSMELFVGICIIPFLSALFIQAGQNDDCDDHDFL